MNVFIQELKANRKSLIYWCIGVLLMVAVGMGKYTGMSASQTSLNEMMAKMPKAIQSFIGSDAFDLSTAGGFYGLLYIYLILMAAVHSVVLGSNIIAKEERDKTAEFLFVKPASRVRIITAKLLAAFVNIFIFNGFTFVSSIIITYFVSNGENLNAEIFNLMIGMLWVQLIFLTMGACLASISKNPKRAGGLSTGILLILYFLSMGIDMSEKIDFLKYFTPFQYFSAKTIMINGQFEAIFITISTLLIGVLGWFAIVYYRNKDLNI